MCRGKDRAREGDGYKPTYLWEGGNYLLKMLHDLDFLEDVETLKEYLGPNLIFTGTHFYC